MGKSILSGHSIQINNLVIGYRYSGKKKNVVFGPFNLELNNAEMVGIIGRNGIGKSTLLRTIAGLQKQLAGSVQIDHDNIEKLSVLNRAKKISYVSTEPVHVSQLKVGELIALGRIPHTNWFGKMNKTHLDIIYHAAELTGVKHLMIKELHEISDGERQKVMIARALAQDTPVIVLDEPTAFLDVPSRYEIISLLNDLTSKSGKTIIFTTHDLAMAIDIADKIWLMTDDEIHQGAPEDLLINKVFHKLFINSPVVFDNKTLLFKFKRESKNEVVLKGDKRYRSMTIKAMERLGIQITENDTCRNILTIQVADKYPVWKLTDKDQTIVTFRSIYELALFFKEIYKSDTN